MLNGEKIDSRVRLMPLSQKEDKEDTLSIILCSSNSFSRYREEEINNLQVQAMILTGVDVLLLHPLENMLDRNCIVLEDAPE